MKYPEYVSGESAVPKVTTSSVQHETVKNIASRKGIYYLKLHKCSKATAYFDSLGDSFNADYCLLVSYGYCSMFKKAKKVFEKLENKNVNNIWQSRLYATFGLISMINKKGRFRDYLTVAYAYDGNNQLAKELMFKTNLNEFDKQKYFNEIFLWCEK